MRFLLLFLLEGLILLIPIYTHGQSLFKDALRLNQLIQDQGHLEQQYDKFETRAAIFNARTTLDSIQQSTLRQVRDSLQQVRQDLGRQTAEILAILDHYQNWSTEPAVDDVKLMAERSLKAYRNNEELATILSKFQLPQKPFNKAFFEREYLKARTDLKSAKDREQIMDLLTSSYPQSPREYLSVRKTLRDYQEPPLSNLEALQSATKEANRNVNQGLPNERELIIGLFTFLMERAQEEVIINFLERLLGRNGIQQFKELFPSTSTAFEDLSFNFSDSFVKRLRQAFYEDIQLLSVSLPSLLTNPDYFQLLDEDPIAYSFLQLYSMIGMGQQGVPITEIVPFTFRNVFDLYQSKRKKINLNIASSFQNFPEYESLIVTTQGIINELVDISLVLDSVQQETLQAFNKLYSQPLAVDHSFDLPSLTSTDASNAAATATAAIFDLISQPPSPTEPTVDVTLFIRKLPYDGKKGPIDDFIKLVNKNQKTIRISEKDNFLTLEDTIKGVPTASLDALQNLLENANTLAKVPMADAEYQGLLKLLNPDDGYSLKLLPSLLDAKFDPSIINSWSTLGSYDQFLRNPLSEQQMRAAGLALARRLDGSWYNDMSISEMLRQWQKDALNYQSLFIKTKDELFPLQKLAEEKEAFEQALADIKALIPALKQHYRPETGGYEDYQLSVLQKIVDENIYQGQIVLSQADGIRLGMQTIAEIEERLLEVEERLFAQNSSVSTPSPIKAYFENKQKTDPLQAVVYKIDSLEILLGELQDELTALDKALVQPELDAVRPISPLVQITESLSHLMYCLRDEDSPTGWLQRPKLNEALLDQDIAPVFLGLLGQQLKQSKVEGAFSMGSLTQFIRMSLEDLNHMRVKEFTQDSIDISFFKKAAFVNITLNRLLEMPLFVDKTDHTKAISLLSLYEELTPIPKLSDLALNFIYHTNIKDHRHAVTDFIRLLTEVMQVVDDRAEAQFHKALKLAKDMPKAEIAIKPYKPSKALAFMKKYGYFMADLIDADSSAEVKTLLEGIADPPGSSRVKRREPFTANINGYVGILAGSETLRNIPDPNKTKQSYATFAPTLPVGISLSRLVGKGPKPESFSLFLSVLDLGSLTTYSLGDDVTGENQISFKNILKPGVQLHWNIQNSPFFLGVGAQTGPRFREFNGEQKSVQATTLFFNMGIDVVIKRLY